MSTHYRARMGVYTRLSVEADASSTSLDGQSEALVAMADREGWDIVMERQDNGKSGGKERANARELLDALRDGSIDVLGVASFDRWTRMGIADAAKVIEVVTERNVAAKRGKGRPALFVAEREGIRSDVEGWELRVAFAADMARMERERIASRVTAARARLRTAGRFAGGTVPFGYRPVDRDGGGRTLTVSRFEAEVVRDIIDRLLRNESTNSLAADLTARGIARPRSDWRRALILTGRPPADEEDLTRGHWTPAALRDVVRSERLLGRAQHSHRTPTDAEGVPVAAYPPVIDVETHQRILARLPGRGASQVRRKASRLLSGLVYCSACGCVCYPAAGAGAHVNYRCSAPVQGVVCAQQRVSVSADRLEDYVVGTFMALAGRIPETVEVEAADPGTARLAGIREAISQTTVQLADRGADRVALLERLDALQATEAELEALPSQPTVERRRTGRTLAEAWEAAETLAERRAAMAPWLDHIRLAPFGGGKRVFNPSRVTIEWAAGVEDVVADLVD